MKRHASLYALGFLASVVFCAAIGGGSSLAQSPQSVKGRVTPMDDHSPPDPSLVAEVSRLVEASLEALRDGRDDRHERFLQESLEKLPNFPPRGGNRAMYGSKAPGCTSIRFRI